MTGPGSIAVNGLDARSFVVIADAEEVMSRPALLATFASAFGPASDATLVLAADDVGALSAAFSSAQATISLADEALPDVLALPVGSLADAPPALAASVHAVLSDTRVGGVWADLPRCSVADGDLLRRLGAHRGALARTRANLPDRLALPDHYVARSAPEYFDDVHRVDAGIVHQPDVYAAVAAIALRAGASHIVDIGCGAAEKLLLLAPEFHLIGVDFGSNLEHCRTSYPEHTWLRWDIEREPVPDLPPALLARAVVICADVIEHLIDPTGLIVGLRRLAEDAQAIVLSTPDRERVRGPLDSGPPQNPSHVREWTLEELTSLLDAGGLTPTFAGHTVNNDRDRLKRTSVAIIDPRRDGPIESAPDDFEVTAVVCAFNEADVIECSVLRLVEQGVRVHVVDNWSTDDTVARVEALELGDRVRIERFPAHGPSATYDWAALLRNTERIAATLGDSWVIHQDADEVRESPWPGIGLRDALHHVQCCGYNAVDHTVIDFVPVDDDFVAGAFDDHMRHFRFGDRPGHFVQVKAWRAGSGHVDLASSGGHDARFDGRRVFPYKFLARHYPIRSQAHGRRKVLRDRVARWNPQERTIGWHHQYDQITDDHSFIRPADELLRHDRSFWTEFVLERLTGVGIVTSARADLTDPRPAVSAA